MDKNFGDYNYSVIQAHGNGKNNLIFYDLSE